MIYQDLINRIPELKKPLEALDTRVGAFGDLPKEKHAYAVMGLAGDTKSLWDPNVPAEVEAARELFNSLTKKGYRAFYVTGEKGEKGELMREFDPKASKVIFVPQLQGG